MLKLRNRRRDVAAARAASRIADINAAVAALKDDDLLDLVDIFADEAPSLLREFAYAEMSRRGLSL